MLGEKKIKATLFGEEIILDFGLRFSGKLRKKYPNFAETAESGDFLQLILMSVTSALPDQFDSKTDDEVIDEIDRLDDPMLVNRCVEGFKSAMGFLNVALTGLTNAAVAVGKVAKPKS